MEVLERDGVSEQDVRCKIRIIVRGSVAASALQHAHEHDHDQPRSCSPMQGLEAVAGDSVGETVA